MSPILGIIASSKFAAVGDFESIATVTVGSGGSSSVSFSSIPSTYAHLQIRGIARTTAVNNNTNILTQFNSDTSANYTQHELYGNGTSAAAFGAANTTNIIGAIGSPQSATSGTFGAFVIDILDYADTNKYKTLRSLSGSDANGSGFVFFNSGLWRSTTAISSIQLTTDGTNFAQYSSFALYGIKGA